VSNRGLICIVELTNNYFRVLHINSGVTLTDTHGINAALTFVKDVEARMSRDPKFKKAMSAINWGAFCQYEKGHQDSFCEYIFNVIEPYSCKLNNVAKTVTATERYLYPSEPII
jgi:hypothetical protein